MIYDLPEELEVSGQRYEIRSDYRAALDICAALSDPELSDREKALAALDIFYPAFSEMPPEHYEDGVRKCFLVFELRRARRDRSAPKLMDWEQDFQYVVAPINRVIGREIRAADHLHWWTFISAYYEIGDCLFSTIVRIRREKAKGKALDKADRTWYRENRELVDFRVRYTQAEQDVLKQWGGR